MTPPLHNESDCDPQRHAEETLRLIARLPAPEGLVDRVKSSLRLAPRRSGVLAWPYTLMPGSWIHSPVVRGAAAAAIVCLVAGGGWRIYSHVQPAPTAKVIVMPARVGNAGGFSNAGAMRTPDTLNGPVLTHGVIPAMQNPVAPAPRVTPQIVKPQAVTPQPGAMTHKKRAAAAPR